MKTSDLIEKLFELIPDSLQRSATRRELIRERTQARFLSVRIRGRKGGRQKGLSPEAEKNARLAEIYYREGVLEVNMIAKKLGMSKVTFYKYLRHRGVKIHSKQAAETPSNG